MRVLVLLATLSFVGVGGVVGVKLLLLARRTRQLPEFTVGLGLFLIALVGYPLSLASLAPALSPGMAALCFAVGTSATTVGSAAVYVFTWRVFRPDASWARALSVVAIGTLFAFAVVTLVRLADGETPAGLFRDRLSASRNFVTGFSYVWTAAESLRYYGLLRRRMGLGLADPVVANRFLLWGISGVAAILGTGVSTAMTFTGSAQGGAHPVSLLAIGVAGLTSSVVLYLAFLPPTAWRRFVAGRALARTR